MEAQVKRPDRSTLRYSQRELPDLQELARLLDYDPTTGKIVWRESRSRTKAGTEAGFADAQHYRRINFFGRMIASHRVAWALGHGKIPPVTHVVDHINGDREDNRLENLRLLTPAENSKNRKANAGKELPKGVRKDGMNFSARVNVRGTMMHLGTFTTRDEAARAYDAAAREHLGPLCKTNADLGLIPERSHEWQRARELVRAWLETDSTYEALIDRIAEALTHAEAAE